MSWLYLNINHLAVPLGILLALFSVIVGLDRRRRLKAGLPPAPFRGGFAVFVIAFLCLCCVFFGVVLVRDFI